MVVQDTRKWFRGGTPPPDREILYVEQVRSVLGIRERLCMPPLASLDDHGSIEGTWIPAVRFPTWMRCPSCGLLYDKPWAGKRPKPRLKCTCGKILEQVPWVVVHEAGYLADVPWHVIAHADSPQCRAFEGEGPYLRLVDIGRRRGVACRACKAKGKLPQRLAFPSLADQQPWLFRTPPDPVSQPAALVEINDVRTHAPVTREALVIPPESRIRKDTVVDRLYSNSEIQGKLRQGANELRRRAALKRVAREWRCTTDAIEDAVLQIEAGYPLNGQELPKGSLSETEFKALVEEIPHLREDEDLVTEHHTDAWKRHARTLGPTTRKAARTVDRLIEVRRLKAVLVSTGFRRFAGDGRVVAPDIAGTSSWLPAVALRGEGIFFTLDESVVARWERQEALQERTDILRRRYLLYGTGALGGDAEVTPRFLLLHTLAHLLLRRLESESGYPAASLRERVYSASGDAPMAGVLIYLAVADEAGSLGGLAELAAPRPFLRFLAAAFEAASWCSLDPVCSGHEGQGPGQLNLAACHACALLPETSCAHGNVLLDRVFVCGDPEAGIRSVLDCGEE